MTDPTNDLLAQLEEAEWTAPQGRPVKQSPYLPVVQKADNDGKAYALVINLNGKNPQEQVNDLQKHVMLFRKAGSQLDTPKTVLVQSGEIDSKKGTVRVTFMTREKITRNRSQESVESAQAVTDGAKTNGK